MKALRNVTSIKKNDRVIADNECGGMAKSGKKVEVQVLC
jgi:hypothetical protein